MYAPTTTFLRISSKLSHLHLSSAVGTTTNVLHRSVAAAYSPWNTWITRTCGYNSPKNWRAVYHTRIWNQYRVLNGIVDYSHTKLTEY